MNGVCGNPGQAWTRTPTKLDAMKLVAEAGTPARAVLDTASSS